MDSCGIRYDKAMEGINTLFFSLDRSIPIKIEFKKNKRMLHKSQNFIRFEF